ncbi:MAG TPA: phenylalanine--tRNA ligase subunit beta [Gemmatimonadales bacterium]|jgi:phenylalanyl-tRNA synthetase beta chain|nr:phenylalanine--tRNA ligase subunit beta [Gemmatimonadales bacterium]
MNLSLRWLEAFLRRALDPTDVSERLAMLGAPVDAVEPVHPGLESLVVARVLEVTPHPNPKFTKVRLTRVDDGTGEPKVVACGASNVTAGKLYPFARVGTSVPGGKKGPLEIGARAIGGVTSVGMLCSLAELGLADDAEGIWELATDAAPGTPLLDAIPLADHRLVVDVTPNRPDLLCHKGVARELATSFEAQFRLPPIPGAQAIDVPPSRRAGATGSVGQIRVTIEDPDSCPRFHAALIRGVTVGPSPEWLRRRLESVGERSINNVVDATNYVMFELNQPMHAYDAALLRGGSLIVRRARAGERLVTLDDQGRALTPDMVAIADAEGVIGLAGLMGGASSEVGLQTRDVLLEGAYWNPARTRATRRTLGMSTEASYRFERGIDRWGGVEAMRRCLEIILAAAGGELAEAPLDLWPSPSNPPRIFLRPARVAQVLGVELPWQVLERYLVAIGATVVSKPEDARMAVEVPGWRPDLVREIDLIEEIARLHGYDNFPSDLRPFRLGGLPDSRVERVVDQVRRGMVEQGLFEVVTLPMGPADGEESVRLLNPLSADDAYLRRRLLPGLVRLVEGNWANHVSDVRLFEIGTAFVAAPAGSRPREERRLAAVLTGRREPQHWTGTGEARFDLWDLKGRVEAAAALAVPGAVVQVQDHAWVVRDRDGRVVGQAGPLEADAPPWAAPLFGLELVIDPAPRRPPAFQSLPTTPSSERVLALLLPEGTSARQVEDLLRQAGGPLLERVDIESDYRGPELPAGTRSVAFRLTFRAPDRTLRDTEVDEVETGLLAALAGELGVVRRDAGTTRGGG